MQRHWCPLYIDPWCAKCLWHNWFDASIQPSCIVRFCTPRLCHHFTFSYKHILYFVYRNRLRFTEQNRIRWDRPEHPLWPLTARGTNEYLDLSLVKRWGGNDVAQATVQMRMMFSDVCLLRSSISFDAFCLTKFPKIGSWHVESYQVPNPTHDVNFIPCRNVQCQHPPPLIISMPSTRQIFNVSAFFFLAELNMKHIWAVSATDAPLDQTVSAD